VGGGGLEGQGAGDGRGALEVWERWQPGAIFMDLRMPRMGGEEAVSRLRQREGNPRRTAVFALTASVLGMEHDRIIATGFDEFLQKPFQEPVLAEVLERYLGVRFKTEGLAGSQSAGTPHVSWDELPEDWRQNFREALLLCDLDAAESLLGDLGQHPAREYLEPLVKGFHFQAVLEEMGE